MSVVFVIITALKEEQEALITRLPPVQRLPPTDDDVHVYYRTELPVTLSGGATGSYTLILLSIMGMTREKAAIFTTDALHRWHPRYVLLMGIAGGIAAAKVARGDVLISEQIVDYEPQKITAEGEREQRWEVHQGDPRLLEASRHLGDDWRLMIRKRRPQPGKPATFFGPIATGDKVVDYPAFLSDLLSHWPKLIGVEMESGGAASAAFQAAKAAGFFMIRGVSELAENKDDAWRQYACHTAAAYVLALLQSGPVPLAMPVASKTIEPSEPADTIKELTAKKRRSGRRWPLLTGGTPGLISLLAVLILSLKPLLFVRGGPSPTPTMPAQATIIAIQNLYNQMISKPPTIDDPLVDNSQGYQWNEVNTPSYGLFCQFEAGAYHVSKILTNQFTRCTATKTHYSDFIYQVEATIFKGDLAGVIFRFNRSIATFYSFYVGVDGTYSMETNNMNGWLSSLTSGQSPFIKTGYNRPNVITIVAQGSNILIYINKQFLTSVNDMTYSQGSIGVAVDDAGDPTEVGFRNVTLWQL